jgi:HD-GYP domain-containing protein (c-di-GMP phosphodiesterase class II)
LIDQLIEARRCVRAGTASDAGAGLSRRRPDAADCLGLMRSEKNAPYDACDLPMRLATAHMNLATALIATLDVRDRWTAGHSAVVAIYARDIAKELALSEQDQQLAYLSGLLHDIGAIGLPPGLLEKPGELTLDERRQMQQHSAIGERILAKWRTMPRSPRSSGITTSGSMEWAIRMVSPARRSR